MNYQSTSERNFPKMLDIFCKWYYLPNQNQTSKKCEIFSASDIIYLKPMLEVVAQKCTTKSTDFAQWAP